MKKSKLMKALLVFGMSMVTATSIVGFTACGDEHDHVDENKDGKCDICETDMTEGGNQGGGVTVAVTKVELDESEITLDIGGEKTLTATVTPDNADNKTVTWTSSNPSVATVSNSGKVTAVAPGTTTITAMAGGKTATCSVKVNEPAPQPEVTEDEWKEILGSVNNYTLDASSETSEDYDVHIEVDGDKVALGDDEIYVKDGEHYYLYYYDGETEEWVKEEIEDQDYEEYVGPYIALVKSFKDDYEAFTYADGVYTAASVDKSEELDSVFNNVEFTFDNGKLIGVKFETVDESSEEPEESEEPEPTEEQAEEPTEGTTEEPTEGTTEDPTEDPAVTVINYEVTKVGSTTVKLPTIGGEEENGEGAVTAEEWAEILESVTNFTFDTSSEVNESINTHVEVDGDKTLIETNTKNIYVKDGESYYLYTYENDEWAKSDSDADAYGQYAGYGSDLVSMFKNYYESFELVDGVYTAEALDTSNDTIGAPINNIEIAFDNGALVSIKFEINVGTDAEPVTAVYEFTSVGSTSVELPTIGGETPDPEVPNIITWATVGDAIYGEVTVDGVDHIWHHLYFQDVGKNYDFDSYTATVTLDGADGTVVECLFDAPSNDNENNYHLKIQILGNKYQTAVFTINFKKDGETVATGTYTRVGNKEIVLDDDTFNISKDATEATTVSVLKVNGKTDLSGLKITWSISDTSIATITDNENGTVSVTGVAVGTATLTCTVGEGANAFSTTCAIKVVEGEAKDEDPVDVSTQLHEQETYGEWNINIRLDCDAELCGKIVSVEVTATMDGETTNVTVHEVYGGGTTKYVKMGVSKDWSHDYVFTINYKNQAGKVIATGTFTKEAQKSLTLSKSTLNLTLKDGETVTETLTATTTGKLEGDLDWSISDTSVATVTDNGDGTATVTAVAKGTATITVTIGNLKKTCNVAVIEEGDTPPTPSLPDKQLTFTAVLNDYYGGTGNAIYHDFISLADITDNFNYSLDNIQVSATLNGQEIKVELLSNGSLGGDKNMHFHAKIGGSDTTLDEIKSGLSITMVFIGTDGQPCAYALIEN